MALEIKTQLKRKKALAGLLRLPDYQEYSTGEEYLVEACSGDASIF